jgi:SNF2 family DNA or RNA helicase
VDKDDPYKNVDRLKLKMREHGAIFMKTEECFELPEQNFITVKCLTSKEYRKFKKDSIITIQDDDREVELIGDTTLTKMMYLRMLCGQYSKDKLEAFKDLVESTNDRLIVFYNFTNELDQMVQLISEMGRKISIVNGQVKDLTAYEHENDSITFVQYQAGSMGLNLQKANKIIYFTLPLLSEHFEQSKKRIHRIGQVNTCFYYLMICKGSIEEQILQTLEMRKDYTDFLFQEDYET